MNSYRMVNERQCKYRKMSNKLKCKGEKNVPDKSREL